MSESNGSAYIPDGYTRAVYLREHPEKLYPACRITFRPILIQKQAGILRQINNANEDPDRQQSIAASWIGRQVVEWNLKKPDGSKIALEQDEILRIHPALFIRVWSVILGDRGGDEDPDYPNLAESARVLSEVISSVADREMADQKN